MTKEELLKGLTKEQIEKVYKCKSEEELLELAKREGVKLTAEQLDAVSGGCDHAETKCPYCGSTNIQRSYTGARQAEHGTEHTCLDCGETFFL